MKRQRDIRIDPDTLVDITLLQKEDGSWRGQCLEQTGALMKIELGADLEAGSILKLETQENWMLAEVRQSEPRKDGFCASLDLLEWISKSELRDLGEPLAA